MAWVYEDEAAFSVGDFCESVTEMAQTSNMSGMVDIAKDGLQIIQPQLQQFEQNCSTLMQLLNVVAEAHPFVKSRYPFLSVKSHD